MQKQWRYSKLAKEYKYIYEITKICRIHKYSLALGGGQLPLELLDVLLRLLEAGGHDGVLLFVLQRLPLVNGHVLDQAVDRVLVLGEVVAGSSSSSRLWDSPKVWIVLLIRSYSSTSLCTACVVLSGCVELWSWASCFSLMSFEIRLLKNCCSSRSSWSFWFTCAQASSRLFCSCSLMKFSCSMRSLVLFCSVFTIDIIIWLVLFLLSRIESSILSGCCMIWIYSSIGMVFILIKVNMHINRCKYINIPDLENLVNLNLKWEKQNQDK
ncbi:Hypothetical_protein [Hexamita inflata]|uniref:Hypothetical_protein n=1 Tax=Hexamita inflata TaxID=28002 RepID=A0AA86P151_9EUKA|nr:Hypothetical protein HINF_LOCUS17293 [Hexamita inflata]